jgi:xanthine dehydrogenase accessory factor
VEEGQAVLLGGGRRHSGQLTGIVRGMLPGGWPSRRHEIRGHRPPLRREHCFSVSDKARAVGGGVLEGLLHFWSEDKMLWND